MLRYSCAIAFCLLLLHSVTAAALERTANVMGPLHVCPDNGRYFCDAAGRAVFIAGSHTWNNLVDMGDKHPPPEFDFDEYLHFLEAHNHNTIRLWTWEVAKPGDSFDTPLRKVAAPLPWPRTGPELARDGLPRFDLSRHNTEYFDRLRQRVIRARQRGFYVIVILFEGWSVQMSPGRNTHPFHPENNINNTNFLEDVEDIHTLKHPEILAIQQRYVEQVILTLTGMDNLLFEIVNEAGGYSTEWQYHMIEFVRFRLAEQGDIAPVGMSFQTHIESNSTLFTSKADWIAPGGQPGFYRSNPEMARGKKVVIADTDHIAGSSLLDPNWPYKGLLRGLNLLYMDRYRGPASVSSTELHAATPIRANLGIARLLANSLDIAAALPNPGLASSRYALQADDWLLVFAPGGDLLEVDLRPYDGTLEIEWFDTLRARTMNAGTVTGGDFAAFNPPVRDGALLYLRRAKSSTPTMQAITPRARAISRASLQYANSLTRLRLAVTPWLSLARRNYSNLAKTLLAAGLAGIVAGLLISFVAFRVLFRR